MKNSIFNLLFNRNYTKNVKNKNSNIFRHFKLKSDKTTFDSPGGFIMDMDSVRTWLSNIISFIRDNKLAAATFLGVLIGILISYFRKRKVFSLFTYL